MVVVTSVHPGPPGLAHEGSRDQTNKMADARGRRIASLGASLPSNGALIGCGRRVITARGRGVLKIANGLTSA